MVVLHAIANPGYRVKRWLGTDDDISKLEYNVVTMKMDLSIGVEFEAIPPQGQLTVQVIGKYGKVTPSNGSFDIGSTVTLTAIPDPGYRVKLWTGTDDDTSVSNINKVTLTGNQMVMIVFERLDTVRQFQMTMKVIGGNGTIWPFGGFYPDGLVVELIARPVSGYKIKSWTNTDNDGSTSTTNKVTANANKVVTVEYVPIDNDSTTPIILTNPL